MNLRSICVRCSFLAFLLTCLAGCRQVKVIDQTGQPLAGVKVLSLSPSAQNGPNITDAYGETSAPFLIGQKWLLIEYKGFTSVRLEEPFNFPLTVTMKK